MAMHIFAGQMQVKLSITHLWKATSWMRLLQKSAEKYTVQKNGLFGMLAVTNGMIKGNVDSAAKGIVNGEVVDDNTNRNPSIILKGGIDKQLADNIRVRVSGSLYHNSSNAGSGLTLYGGDRGGSNYQNVVEKWKDAAGASSLLLQ